LGSDASRQDMLISALITNAPKKISIHGIENDKVNELVETIKSIFLERIFICPGCVRCDEIQGNNLKT
jgi:hypothetical protein